MISSIDAHRVILSVTSDAAAPRVTVARLSYVYRSTSKAADSRIYTEARTCFFANRAGAVTHACATYIHVTFEGEPGLPSLSI